MRVRRFPRFCSRSGNVGTQAYRHEPTLARRYFAMSPCGRTVARRRICLHGRSNASRPRDRNADVTIKFSALGQRADILRCSRSRRARLRNAVRASCNYCEKHHGEGKEGKKSRPPGHVGTGQGANGCGQDGVYNHPLGPRPSRPPADRGVPCPAVHA